MKIKLEIKAINKKYQSTVNQWSRLVDRYTNIVTLIGMKEDLEQSTEALELKEEQIYSSIIEIEKALPKRELQNAKKECVKFLGYEI